jgi:hypothetical protein
MNELSSLSDRVTYLKRAYARGLGHKPTTLQSAAIQRAAVLSAKAEAAALDPNVTPNDLVRLDHAAARARRDMEHALQRVRKPDVPTLAELGLA